MKLFLIKAGKAWEAIKRDGILQGGGRVLNFFWSFVRSSLFVKSGDILIITAGVGDSALYRAHNQAEELQTHGFKVSVTMQDNPFLSGLESKFKIFIFHRTLETSAIKKLIEKIKKQNKEIIFDTDDLVFDVKLIQATDHFKNMSHFEKLQYQKGVGEEILKDPYVKVCTTSTSFIASRLEEYQKKIFVITNKLSNNWVKLSEKLLEEKSLKAKSQKLEAIRIGYFSGTIGHNKDFATISDALIEIMKKYSETELFLAGPLELEDKFSEFSKRIIRSKYVPRKKHFENVSNCDIILAPLEINDHFCEGKSELKFFEAGILKVPTVAVKNQTFSEAIIDGETGFLANNQNEWIEKLSQLIENQELRKNIGEKAREKALRDYTTKNSHCEEYYNYLKSKL